VAFRLSQVAITNGNDLGFDHPVPCNALLQKVVSEAANAPSKDCPKNLRRVVISYYLFQLSAKVNL
jgi:hypothetical protein